MSSIRPSSLLLLAMLLLLLPSSSACNGADGELPPPAPTLTITYPEEGALLKTQRVRVRGTANHTEEVMVAGKPASVVGGQWDAEVPLAEGEVTVTVEARGVSQTRSFRIDASPPTLEIRSPERARFISKSEGETLVVEGEVSDAFSGLSLLKINEQIVAPDAQGHFTHRITLEEGLNTLDVTALDIAGNSSQQLIGAIYGDFVAPESRIEPGFDFTIDRSIFPKVSQVVSALVSPARLKALALTKLSNDNISLEDITFDPIELTITPRSNQQDPKKPGFLDLQVDVSNVKLRGTFTLAGEPAALDVTLDKARVTTTMTLAADGQGSLSVSFGESVLQIDDGALSWKVSAGGSELSDEDSELLSGLVEEIARFAFSELLSEQIIDQLYDPALLNRRIELLGRTLEFTLSIDELITNASGIFARTTLTMPAESYPEIPAHPGALTVESGAGGSPGLSSDAIVTLSEGAMDRLLHGVWQSGLLNQRLSGKDFAGIELPFALETGALALLIDGRVNDYASSTSAAAIALRPQLPPVVSLRAEAQDEASSGLVAELGEVHVDLLLDAESGAPKKLATFALFLELGVALEIRNGNQIGLALRVEGKTDLIDEPLFDMDDAAIEELMQGLFALIPTLLSEELVLNGEADITWLKLTDPQVKIHGSAQRHLSVGITMEPNPGAITSPP